MKLNTIYWSKACIVKIAVIVTLIFGLLAVGPLYFPTSDIAQIEQTQAIIQPAVQNQQKVENEIETYYKAGTYTLDDPLVIQDPYGTAPLTALVIFDTPTSMQISIHIPGKTPLASVDHTFDGFNSHHEIPVYGLYADSLNQVTLIGTDQSGNTSQTVVQLQTEPLPVYLQTIKIIQANPDLYNPGMNFTYLNNKIVFDINGDIRWFSTESTFQAFAKLSDGHYLFTFTVPNEPNNVVMEEDLLGKIYNVYNIPGGVNHDFAELPNGNLLVTTEDPNATTIDDHLIEVDRRTGQILRDFDFKDYLDINRPNEIDALDSDWVHINSVVYDATDQSIIVSCRTQSAVIKFSYPGMQIQWILGPHDNWSAKYQPYLLTPVGDDFEWSWSQHHATIVSENNVNGSEIIDIMLFDNGIYRSFDEATALSGEDSYSRMVRYEINETDRTVRQVWEYGKERGGDLFSISRGSVYLLGNGDYLGTFADIVKDLNGNPSIYQYGGYPVHAEIVEVAPANNQVVFEAQINGIEDYRTFRAGLYDGYSDEYSGLSVKLNDTTQSWEEWLVTVVQQVKGKLGAIGL